MTEPKKKITALLHQVEFMDSEAVHTGLVAGFGSGKSKAATFKTVRKKMKYPGIDVAYYLPTYGLIRDIAFRNFPEVLDQLNAPFELNRSLFEINTPFGRIIFRSLTNTDTIVGYEVGYSIIDEADILEKSKMWEAFRKVVGRNRVKLPDGKPNSVDLVSTPEGFRFMYEFFVKSDSKNRVLIKAKTSDNPFLPDTYIQTMIETYTPEQLQAYLNGEFVNLTSGTVHHTFDRQLNHTDRRIQKGDVLHIGMDFNITNMSAVVHVLEGRTVHAVDEVTKAFDTQAMIRLIQERFKGHRVIIYPDASGANRKTSSSETDISLLKKAGFVVRNPRSNPSVRDRITVMNTSFCNQKGERSVFVNTEMCAELTEALEKLPYKNGEPDKTSGFDHLPEAHGYFIYQHSTKKPTRITV